MTRTAFLAALEQLLAPLPEAERKDALSYYEDYLDAAGPENEARAIAELGSPEEVARKILDEQSPQGASAAPASPAPRSRWRMVLGGGLAVLVLACFFFQHSKATPVQPVESISPSSEIPVSSAEVPAESSSTQPAAPVSTPDGLTFSLSAEMVSDKLSLTLDYGTVLFVVDPNVSDITLQFDGFRTRYLTHSNKKDGTAEFSYHVPKYYALPDIDSAVLTITAPENILHEIDIDLAMGNVDLGTLSVEELDLELAMGDVIANSLTVKDADFNLAMGGCHIDHLSAPEFDAELAIGDCTIGMLSGAQDVSISVITGDTDLTLEGSASDYYLVTNGLTGTSIHDGKANTSRKISLSSTTGNLSISYTN
ncbi:MAG: DUF4097 family beta strand repeat-containing protein [Faecalibacterium sp.]|nr:DUF4097 family beta strand repeat-containing protein [Faecalibacterium sp.]